MAQAQNSLLLYLLNGNVYAVIKRYLRQMTILKSFNFNKFLLLKESCFKVPSSRLQRNICFSEILAHSHSLFLIYSYTLNRERRKRGSIEQQKAREEMKTRWRGRREVDWLGRKREKKSLGMRQVKNESGIDNRHTPTPGVYFINILKHSFYALKCSGT